VPGRRFSGRFPKYYPEVFFIRFCIFISLNLKNQNMKKLRDLAFFICSLLLTATGFSQKVNLIEGDLSPLRTEKSIDFIFKYDSMTVGKGRKATPEAEYVSKKTAEYNKKTPGKGDDWAKSWKDDREIKYQPAFTKAFEQYSSLQMTAKAKYTLIFRTTMTEPGFNIMVHQEPAQIDGQAWVIETANPTHVIAKLEVIRANGRGYWGSDFDTGERLTEAYETAGRALGYFIKGKL
jgi:hypothetical protein